MLSLAIEPRPYQLATEQAVRAHWAAGRWRAVVALPTGAGKTTVAAMCLAGAPQPIALVHTITLLEQTSRRLPGVPVYTIQGALARGRPIAASHAFVDEYHHAVAPSWRPVLDLLPPDCRIIGPTATPERADGRPLRGAADALVALASYSHLLANGWLAPCRVVPCRGMDPATAYLVHGNGRPGVLFAPTIVECRAAVARLSAAGIRAACVDARTSKAHRRAIVAAYDAGQLDVLASPMALAEGFDSPRAEVCILARECQHVGSYLQIVGRVLRPYPSKLEGVLLDCTGAAERHGCPTDDRAYSLDAGIQRAPSRAAPRRSGVVRRHTPAEAAGAHIGGWLRTLWNCVRKAG